MLAKVVTLNFSVVILMMCAASVSTGDPVANKPIWSKKGISFPLDVTLPLSAPVGS